MEPTHNSLLIANRFIFNKKVKIYIKLFWLLIILLSFWGFLFYINAAWTKFIVTPIIEIKTMKRSIQSAPFPAVTICSPVFAKNRIVTQADVDGDCSNLTDYQMEVLAANTQACNPSYYQDWCGNSSSRNIVKLLDESSLRIDEFFATCVLDNLIVNCPMVLKKVITDRGFCYTTNSQGYHAIFNPGVLTEDFDSHKATGISKSFKKFDVVFNDTSAEEFSDWGVEGFKKSHDPYSVPFTAFKNTKLSFHLYLDPINANNVCSRNGKSFYFFFHPPNELITPFNWENGVEYGYEKKVAIMIESYSTNSQLRMFPPSARNCLYSDEKQLKYFRVYTKNLCEFECLTNYTLELCGCVKFSMPRTEETQVCGLKDISCYMKALNSWPGNKSGQRIPCGCLRNCDYFMYMSRFEKYSVNENPATIRRFRNITEGSAYALLSLEVVDHLLTHNEYYPIYTFQGFVADIGGILGLFLGFSLLTIFEIFYGFTKFVITKLGC